MFKLYMPAEFILKEGNVKECIDIWSLGCIFADLIQFDEDICEDITKRKSLFSVKYTNYLFLTEIFFFFESNQDI